MKPVINLNELEFRKHEQDDFCAEFAPVSEKIGAKRLGYNLSVVPPGKKVCPYHSHYINEEMFLIIEGEGLLRFGGKEYPLKPQDIIACPPGGRSVAHQIINTGQADLKYLALSTNDPYEICEYPDSDKVMSMVGTYEKNEFRHIGKLQQSVGYFEGEE